MKHPKRFYLPAPSPAQRFPKANAGIEEEYRRNISRAVREMNSDFQTNIIAFYKKYGTTSISDSNPYHDEKGRFSSKKSLTETKEFQELQEKWKNILDVLEKIEKPFLLKLKNVKLQRPIVVGEIKHEGEIWPVILKEGNKKFGRRHIEEDHGAQLRGNDFKNAEEYVLHILKHPHFDKEQKRNNKINRIVGRKSSTSGKAEFSFLGLIGKNNHFSVTSAYRADIKEILEKKDANSEVRLASNVRTKDSSKTFIHSDRYQNQEHDEQVDEIHPHLSDDDKIFTHLIQDVLQDRVKVIDNSPEAITALLLLMGYLLIKWNKRFTEIAAPIVLPFIKALFSFQKSGFCRSLKAIHEARNYTPKFFLPLIYAHDGKNPYEEPKNWQQERTPELPTNRSHTGRRKRKTREEITVAYNVSKIKPIPKQYHDRIEATVLNSLMNGWPLNTLIENLKKDFGITYRRAKFIATDQNRAITASLNLLEALELWGPDQNARWWHIQGGEKYPRR